MRGASRTNGAIVSTRNSATRPARLVGGQREDGAGERDGERGIRGDVDGVQLGEPGQAGVGRPVGVGEAPEAPTGRGPTPPDEPDAGAAAATHAARPRCGRRRPRDGAREGRAGVGDVMTFSILPRRRGWRATAHAGRRAGRVGRRGPRRGADRLRRVESCVPSARARGWSTGGPDESVSAGRATVLLDCAERSRVERTEPSPEGPRHERSTGDAAGAGDSAADAGAPAPEPRRAAVGAGSAQHHRGRPGAGLRCDERHPVARAARAGSSRPCSVGVCIAVGYGLGAFVGWAYRALGLPDLPAPAPPRGLEGAGRRRRRRPPRHGVARPDVAGRPARAARHGHLRAVAVAARAAAGTGRRRAARRLRPGPSRPWVGSCSARSAGCSPRASRG